MKQVLTTLFPLALLLVPITGPSTAVGGQVINCKCDYMSPGTNKPGHAAVVCPNQIAKGAEIRWQTFNGKKMAEKGKLPLKKDLPANKVLQIKVKKKAKECKAQAAKP